MTPEDRLRQAMEARAASVEPSAGSLEQIEEGVAAARRRDVRNRVLLGLGSAAALVAVVVGVLVVAGDDDRPVADDPTTTTQPTTTTTDPTTTTSVGTTTTTTTFAPTVDPAVPIWPRVDSSQRFDEPESAARSFAVDFAGMVDPIVGAFQAGDARSGEVPVQPAANGPVTTVMVRQLEDDTWYVLGATTPDIRVDTPAARTTIECPVRLTGEALAFEGVVQVAILADGVDEPIGTGTVMGGGGPGAPFDGTVTCALDRLDDGIHHGAIVLSTEGGEDGRPWQLTVIRVALK